MLRAWDAILTLFFLSLCAVDGSSSGISGAFGMNALRTSYCKWRFLVCGRSHGGACHSGAPRCRRLDRYRNNIDVTRRQSGVSLESSS